MFCRTCQYAIENQLDDCGAIQDPALLEHLKHCSGCQAFYDRLRRMEQKLRSPAALDVSDKQVEKICAAVSQRISENNTTRSDVRIPPAAGFRLHYGITAAAAALLVVLGSMVYFHRSRPPQMSDPAAAFVSNTAAFQDRLTVIARLPEQSIQAEMQKLNRNARSAVTFLADCIPASPAAGQTQDDGQ